MKKSVELTNYDTICDSYIENTEHTLSYNNLYERPYMVSIFDNFKNKHVLDVGCGTGFYSLYALKQNARVTAIDASQLMLDYLKKNDRLNKIVTFKTDLKDGIPFIKDGTRDYIICSLVLHYIEKWDTIINEFYRVLKRKGKLYISTHHPFSDYLHLKKTSYFDKDFVEDTWGSKENRFKVYYYTRSLTDILKPLLDSHFNILRIEEPLPTAECKKLDPGVYKQLSERPAFIFITLEKP